MWVFYDNMFDLFFFALQVSSIVRFWRRPDCLSFPAEIRSRLSWFYFDFGLTWKREEKVFPTPSDLELETVRNCFSKKVRG